MIPASLPNFAVISAVCATVVKNIRNGDTADLNALLGTLKPMYEKAIKAIESL